MLKGRILVMLFLLPVYAGTIFAADVILNEYNAVGAGEYLQNYGTDTYWGRVMGNGGDWFELVVITDHLDMRGWKLDLWDNGVFDETLNLTYDTIWSDLRSGTIITISEDLADDISYNPLAQGGDCWINVQARDDASALYIEASNFRVNNDDWQLIIRRPDESIAFGPAGEGISPVDGINNTEIFRLEADPSAFITPGSPYYDDGSSVSTFGAPNQWGLNVQDFSQLRSVIPEPATLLLLGLGGMVLLKKRQR